MLDNQEKYRYNRHLILDEVGEEGQRKLKESSVLVVGAGGLGCPALMYLAAAGVGRIGIIDFDKVDVSNLQRQVLFTTEDVGKNKASAAANRLTNLNPHLIYEVYTEALTTKNALELFKQYDIVIDGSDNFSTRYMVNDASVISETPLIYGSIFKFEGQLSVFNYKDGPSYRCIFPDPPKDGTVPNCSEIGVIGVLPGIIGSQQANEVIKIILEIGEPLSGRLLMYDALGCNYSSINIKRNEETIALTVAMAKSFEDFDYGEYCGEVSSSSNIEEIDLFEFIERLKTGIQVVDVREEFELPRVKHKNLLVAPLPELDGFVERIEKETEVIVICQHGVRSLNAIEKLRTEYNFDKLINLKGGVNNYGEE
jgi:sulfur-carrier protein adenylyltransferase/sulfurtransferase